MGMASVLTRRRELHARCQCADERKVGHFDATPGSGKARTDKSRTADVTRIVRHPHTADHDGGARGARTWHPRWGGAARSGRRRPRPFARFHAPRARPAACFSLPAGGAVVFRGRRDAGEKLAEALAPVLRPPCVVAAIPRGGVSVALPIVERFRLPLALAHARKLTAPSAPPVALRAPRGAGPARPARP